MALTGPRIDLQFLQTLAPSKLGPIYQPCHELLLFLKNNLRGGCLLVSRLPQFCIKPIRFILACFTPSCQRKMDSPLSF